MKSIAEALKRSFKTAQVGHCSNKDFTRMNSPEPNLRFSN